jgi:hypothetical protein
MPTQAQAASPSAANFFTKEKSGSLEPLTKRRSEGNASGKAMQDDEVEARARTFAEEKSKILEEG